MPRLSSKNKIAPLPLAKVSSKHSRFQDNKERKCKLFKSFQKKFLNKNESITEEA